MLKEELDNDDFLGSLHILLLMDDAILLATSKESMCRKVKIVQSYCEIYGMSMNMKKTKFMVINGTTEDKKEIMSRNVIFKHCDSYIYLGSPVTSDGLYSSAVSLHVEEKMKHFTKYCIFLDKNPDIPFWIKKRIAEACLFSTVLYACGTWLTNDYGKLNSLYMKVVKSLLCVRTTSCNDLCLIESDMPSLEKIIEKKRSTFLKNKLSNLNAEDPLKHALDLARSCRTPSMKIIRAALKSNVDIVELGKTEQKNKVVISTSSKRATYKAMNPNLMICTKVNPFQSIYVLPSQDLDYHRIG